MSTAFAPPHPQPTTAATDVSVVVLRGTRVHAARCECETICGLRKGIFVRVDATRPSRAFATNAQYVPFRHERLGAGFWATAYAQNCFCMSCGSATTLACCCCCRCAAASLVDCVSNLLLLLLLLLPLLLFGSAIAQRPTAINARHCLCVVCK